MNLFRTLLFWILLALAGALIAQLMLVDPGFVLIRYLGTEVETTLSGALLLIGTLALAVWLLWKLLALPYRLWRRRLQRQSRSRLVDGLDALHHGRYAQAERLLLQAARDPDFEAPARIAAARAATARGERNAARAHLDALGDGHAVARALALAELALADGRPQDAQAALAALDGTSPPPRAEELRDAARIAIAQSPAVDDAPEEIAIELRDRNGLPYLPSDA